MSAERSAGPPRLAARIVRWRLPAEIAEAIFWLASGEARFVAGANIRVAGGRP